ncbi:MAG: hypothetical protein AAGH90_04510 [Pseudomonadota bacterium]
MEHDSQQASCAFNSATGLGSPVTPNPAIELDLEKYLEAFEGMDLTPDQEAEILKALWEIMCRFVELGWGLTPSTLAEADSQECGQSADSPALSDQLLLDLENSITKNDD